MSLKGFKSGTDIRGYGAVEYSEEKLFLSDKVVSKITVAFAQWLSERNNKDFAELSVSVGRDSRVSGPRIIKAVADTLSSLGVSVKNCGLASTPAMFMSSLDLKCDGAVQITASHHPWERNGLKFFTPDGGLEGSDIATLLEKAESINIDGIVADSAKLTDVDYMSDYAAHLREMIKKGVNAENYEKPLDGFKIIVDAGNGVGGFYAENVLKPLGADTEGSQFLEPDGMFPNHIPNPENADAMKSICSAVINSKADFGIIFDTDVDRAGCVDRDGEEINRNRLVALASYIALEGHDSGVIVTDSVTSDGLKTYIESIGGEHYRFKRGYKNVINKQIELNNNGTFCPLAIETSGHAAFKENYYLDDGAYLMTKIVILIARDKTGNALQDILAPLEQPVEEKELRFAINCEDFKSYGENVIAELEKYYNGREGWKIADDNREGMRISADSENGNGWLLLRLSVHDPIMPLNIESNEEGGVMKIAKDFYEFIRKFDLLDLTPIEKFIDA
ncbi:MAG: phosphomannomutase/phosphoglucomutase [Clostridia bacterium]|nr:phosphomannomutase/phosphoglucomutase [Clostridia bacterium]